MREDKEKRPKERPKYNLWQNSWYMICLAWRERISVLYLCLVLVIIAVATNLAELFIAPVILRKVEAAVPLGEMIATILLFVLLLLALASLNAYVSTNTKYGRVALRISTVRMIHRKLSTTSYPNTEDPAVLKKFEKARRAVSSNSEATEAVLNTLTDLLKNLLGFCIYLALLSSLDAVLIAVVLVTTVAGYFVNKRINEWGFRHREEEAGYYQKMSYVIKKAEERGLAKDIRIFGMRPWLEDVYKSTLRLYEAFVSRREKVYSIHMDKRD